MSVSKKDKLFSVFCYGFIFMYVGLAILPFIYIFLTSVSDSGGITAFRNATFSLKSYIGLFKYGELGKSLMNSFFMSTIGTFFNMLLTVPCAYALSQKATPHKNKIITVLMVSIFLFGGTIPSYIWMNKLNLINSYWAVWLTKFISVYNILILKTCFERIPTNIVDAARIDGVSEWDLLTKIVVPMSRSAIVIITIFYFSSWWNDYYISMIYLHDTNLYTLPIRIIQMITNVENSSVYSVYDAAYSNLSVYGIRAAGIVVSTLPMMLIVPFLQKKYINTMFNKEKK